MGTSAGPLTSEVLRRVRGVRIFSHWLSGVASPIEDGRTEDCMFGPEKSLATPPITTAWEEVGRRREWVGGVSGVSD